jgi:hypothetical protein
VVPCALAPACWSGFRLRLRILPDHFGTPIGSLTAEQLEQDTLAHGEIGELRRIAAIPLDRRHNAKIDYTRLHKLLD